MNSFWGFFWDYSFAYYWVLLGDLCAPFLLFVPLDILLDIVFGASWDGIEKWAIWYFPWGLGLNTLAGQFLQVKIENDWPMLDG